MKKMLPLLLAVVMALSARVGGAQPGLDDGAKNAAQARAALDAMVQALGGPAWLNLKNVMQTGQVAAFFHNVPNLGTTEIRQFHQWSDHDRTDVTKHRDVVEFFVGREGWEVTYRGKKALPQDQVDEFLRRRDHSIETAVKVWLKDPKTILVYEGKKMSGRRMADQVTLISAGNEAITLQIDSDNHLPLSRSFQWRDPVYKDKNTDREEYDGYHVVDGLPTPFTITRYANDEMVRQYYIKQVEYNRDLPADFWDVDAATRRIKK